MLDKRLNHDIAVVLSIQARINVIEPFFGLVQLGPNRTAARATLKSSRTFMLKSVVSESDAIHVVSNTLNCSIISRSIDALPGDKEDANRP